MSFIGLVRISYDLGSLFFGGGGNVIVNASGAEINVLLRLLRRLLQGGRQLGEVRRVAGSRGTRGRTRGAAEIRN